MRARRSVAAAGVALLLALVIRQRLRLPNLAGRTRSTAGPRTKDTRLGRLASSLVVAHPGLSGVHALFDGREAFAARISLAEAAEVSLDVQYYIWERDMSGTLLLDALWRAAERGVHVRLLLDDSGTSGLDDVLAALGGHPNIEIRLFNPFIIRRPKFIGFVTDFTRLNRRMHNKSFTADPSATVIGGRNIGDRYFGVAASSRFIDLDVLAIGPAVLAMTAAFDAYWACDSVYSWEQILPGIAGSALAALKADAARESSEVAAGAYMEAVRRTSVAENLLSGGLSFDWAAVQLLSDDPAKGLGKAALGGLVIDHLEHALGRPERHLCLVSGYFVANEILVGRLAAIAARGVTISVVTNAFDATNVKLVAAGYDKSRKALLRAGIRLFEIHGADPGKEPKVAGHLGESSGSAGSAASFLHAKTFICDHQRVFIGSFNLDPRSAQLNTEQGFVIDSPTLAARVADQIDERIPFIAYEVGLTSDNGLYWLEQDGACGMIRHDVEPGTTWCQRAAIGFLSLLPISWML